MPVYDPKSTAMYGDKDYLIYLLDKKKKKEEEEDIKVPEPIKATTVEPEVYKENISDLRRSESFMQDGEVVLKYFADNKNAFQKVISASSDSDDMVLKKMRKVPIKGTESPDIIEFLRDEDYRLPTLFTHAGLLEEAPEDVLKAYSRIRKRFDEADLGSFSEFMTAAKDITTDVVTDPVNFLGLLAIPFTAGGSTAARVGAQQLAKETVKRNLAARLSAFATPTKVAALEGGIFTGLDDYGRQTRDIAVGLQEGTEIDKGRLYASIGLGAGLGAGLGKIVDLSMSKLDKKFIKRAASPEETTSTDLAEQGLVGDLINKEGIEYSKDRLGLDEDTVSFIEGVFEVIDDKDEVANLVRQYAAKKNISEEGAEYIIVDLMDNYKPIKSKGDVATSLSKVINISKKAPAYYGGKVSGLLDPYVGKSETVAELQKKFRYDIQRSFFGERKTEAQDYAETLSDTLGEYYTNMKLAIDPVLKGNYGKNRDSAYLELSNAIRGVESKDPRINSAALLIRKDLDRAAQELKDYGLYEESRLTAENYFPRVWNRKAIENNKEGLARLLIDSGEAKDGLEASRIIEGMLDKNEGVFGDSTSYGNFFLAKRKFKNITDDTLFEEFLDNDTQNVLFTYYNQISKQIARKKVFGAKNWEEFEKLYAPRIDKELGTSEGRKAIRDLKEVWEAQTGEGQKAFGSGAQTVIDFMSTGTRLALLPLATLSSLTEVLLNISRGGVVNTSKGFSKALKEGAKTLTYEMTDRLVKDHNMSKPEAFRKLQRFGIAFEQASADQVERLSGDSIKSERLQKVNRWFFRANLLEPWTKTVQLTSFNVGRSIIKDNLKAIANHGPKKPTVLIQRKIDELRELNVNINEGLDWLKRTGGDIDVDDKFNYIMDRGAARYTNEIILNPTKESGLRSWVLSQNPFTTLLFQLTTYPTAFTNTVLKDMVRRTSRAISKKDAANFGKVLGTAMTLQGSAMLLNYARNGVFNQDPDYRYKTESDLLIEGFSRWGGNGLYVDVLQRTSRASEYAGPYAAPIVGFTGPAVGLALKATRSYTVADPLVDMMPFYAALPKETRAEVRQGVKEIEKEIKQSLFEEKKYRYGYAKGGEVLDVPNAPTEPDQRIDKMTGQPYDKQAGTAFVDEEDPLRRLGFGG